MGPQHWLESHRGIASLVLPLSAVDKVLALSENASFTSVSSELATLVAGSNLGAKLFGWSTQCIVDAQIQTIVCDEVRNLAERKKVTEAAFVEAVGRAHERVVALSESKTWLEKKREVEIHYGDWALQMTVSGADEEIQLHMRAAVRHWCVSLGLLSSLPAEQQLVAGAENLAVEHIEESLYKKAESARVTAHKLLAGEDSSGVNAEIILDLPAVTKTPLTTKASINFHPKKRKTKKIQSGLAVHEVSSLSLSHNGRGVDCNVQIIMI
eukprot:6472834-Amphidinium_carterae.2